MNILEKITSFFKITLSSTVIVASVCAYSCNEIMAADNNDKKFTVAIDAGHGGKDFGSLGISVAEKDINLAVAKKLQNLILKNMKNVDVVMTRENNIFVGLQKRADIANKSNADIFISIHCNSVDALNPNRTKVAGTSVYALGVDNVPDNLKVAQQENNVIELEDDYNTTYKNYDPTKDESNIIFELLNTDQHVKSLKFAQIAQKELVNTAHRIDRKVRQDNFLVLRNTAMPSVLVELDFICNPEEEKYLKSEDGQMELARALYNALETYIKDSGNNSVKFVNNTRNSNKTSSYASVKTDPGKINKNTKANIPNKNSNKNSKDDSKKNLNQTSKKNNQVTFTVPSNGQVFSSETDQNKISASTQSKSQTTQENKQNKNKDKNQKSSSKKDKNKKNAKLSNSGDQESNIALVKESFVEVSSPEGLGDGGRLISYNGSKSERTHLKSQNNNKSNGQRRRRSERAKQESNRRNVSISNIELLDENRFQISNTSSSQIVTEEIVASTNTQDQSKGKKKKEKNKKAKKEKAPKTNNNKNIVKNNGLTTTNKNGKTVFSYQSGTAASNIASSDIENSNIKSSKGDSNNGVPVTTEQKTPRPVMASPTKSSSSGVMVYKILLVSSDSKLKSNDSRFYGLSPIEMYQENNQYKYTYGSSKDRNEIETKLFELKSFIPEATIVVRPE